MKDQARISSLNVSDHTGPAGRFLVDGPVDGEFLVRKARARTASARCKTFQEADALAKELANFTADVFKARVQAASPYAITDPYLAKYISENNQFKSKYWPDQYVDPVNPTHAQLTKLCDTLACELSPENLCCDGELRGQALQRKTQKLNGAKKALEQMGFTHAWW